MSNRRLRFGVFGLGDFGPSFSKYIGEVADVVAVCDPSSGAVQRFRDQTGWDLPSYSQYEELLTQERLDAVAILSPNFTHRDIAVAAARRGLHVYCEKAMAVSVPQCWDMVRACEEEGVHLMVGHKRRLRPPWSRMIDLKAVLGEPLAITACLYHDARPYNFRGWWTHAVQCGGILDIDGVHTVDWMRAMCGDVAEVAASAAPNIDTRFDFPDNLHVALRFRSGAVASLSVSLNYPLLRFRESGGPLIQYREGAVRFLPAMDHIDLQWQRLSDSSARVERYDDLGFDFAYRKEIGDFVRWVNDGTEPCLTWREGLRCVEVIEAAHLSAQRGGAVVPLPLHPALEPSEANF